MACPPRDAFQIGWICALPIEAAAATLMLDDDFGILEEQDAADSNTYTLGRIGKHHVVVACLPAGQYGTTSATTVANNMLRTFSRSLRIGLMVGIGGGIPSAIHDIRLGDIVISYPQDTCGGVVQYDMGKIIADGEFERTGSLNSPPRALLTAVGKMRAAGFTNDPCYLEYLQNAIGKTARTRKNFSRPTVQCDRLFQANHDHPATASSCDGCLAQWEEIRDEREDNDPQPHYGIIASGNKVIKHGRTREQLRSETGALCFEMEAAGLMLDFPCVVIRGVCDYADSHKNKKWQGYAALAAAAYTKELLEYVPIGHVSQESLVVDVCKELKIEIKGIKRSLDQAFGQQEQHHREIVTFTLTDQQNRCLQTFKISSYEEQKNINPRKAEGTCLWATQSLEYIRWSESNCNNLLIVSADPGCGKSVLSRSIIEDHSEVSDSGVTVCYFFFKDNEEQNHLATALCSVLHQLFSHQPQLLHHAIPLWEKNGEKLRQEVDELWRIFTTAVLSDESYKTICLFDALDECRKVDQNRLIEKLQSFHRLPRSQKQETWLKFLITSRPYGDIQNYFRTTTDSFPHLHLKGEEENDKIHQEIDLVIKMQVKELGKRAPLSPETEQRLKQQLLQMEHRTYLWLHLAIDDIRSTFENSLRPAEEEVEMIPQSVDEAYEKILSRVPTGQVDIARQILQIIVAARRPLTTAEMAIALDIAHYPHAKTAEKTGLEPSQIGEKIRRLCGLFIFINNSKIFLIHQTAREFLISKQSNQADSKIWCQSLNLQKAHNVLSEICLKHLTHYLNCWNLKQKEPPEVFEETIKSHPLLSYSANSWIEHMREATELSEDCLRFAARLSQNPGIWCQFLDPKVKFEYGRSSDDPLPFFWVTRWGLSNVAKVLLEDPMTKINESITKSAAADPIIGNTLMCLLLDTRENDIVITDGLIQKAAENEGRGLEIMKLLLDRKGDEVEITENVLRKAAKNSQTGLSILQLLLAQKEGETKITSAVLESSVMHWPDSDTLSYLLSQEGAEKRITTRLIQKAVTRKNNAILHILCSRGYKYQYVIKKVMKQQFCAKLAKRLPNVAGQYKLSKNLEKRKWNKR